MDEAARTFFLPDEDAFLIGVEHLSPRGIDPDFAAELISDGRVDAAWVACFDQAFQRAHARAGQLWSRAKRYAFPPRLNNVVVVSDHTRAHPYTRTLSWSAWTVYRDDFDPERSSVELATLLLLHAERLNVSSEGDVAQALVANLAFLFGLSDAARADLAEGCARTQRPDAAAWRALGQALPWLERLHHTAVKPLRQDPGEPCATSEESGLIVPQSMLPRLGALAEACGQAAQTSVRAHYDRLGGDGSAGAELLEWLADAAPELALVDHEGGLLWDYTRPAEVEALRPHLASLGEAAGAALRADLELVHERSRRFLDAVKDPAALPHCSAEVVQEGGTYLHARLDRIAFDLTQQSTWLPLREPTPPFQRLLLGARVVHEFGHLADEAGLIGIAPGREEEHARAMAGWAEEFGRLLASFPPPLQERAREQIPPKAGQDMGQALVDFTFTRFPDFPANVVMRALVEPAELEAYVRVNARSHREEKLGPTELLSRYVHEYQYVRLSRIVPDPFVYFLEVTGVERLFCDTGLLQRDDLRRLFESMARVCDCYAFDQERVALRA